MHPDQPARRHVLLSAMRGLAAGIVVSSVCSAPLLAQERDRSLERISLALEQPPPIMRGVGPVESASPKKLGIFTLVPPTSRGEMVRVSIPIGELVTRAFTSVAAANQRRQEEAARRKVEAALEWFARRQLYPRQ
jgi:hypothetical protein